MPTGTAYLSLPPLRLVWNRSIGTNVLSLPLLIVSGGVGTNIYSQASLSLPVMSVQATGLHGLIGKTSNPLIIPAMALQASGLRGPIGGTPNPLLLPLMILHGSVPGHAGQAALILKLLKIRASGNGGIVGSAALSLPLLNIEGQFFFNPSGSASLVVPLLRVIGAGEGQLDVKHLSVPIRKGFVMNLVNWAITEYTDYPFNSFAYFNGLQLGGKEDGIFIIDGPDDDGEDILAYIEGGTEDLFKNFMTRLREAWITSRQDGPMVLKVSMGEEETSPVAERPLESADRKMHEERVKFPRGLKERFASFRLENVNGSDFDLKSIKIFLEQISRRR
jgi:hypothetical protein